MNRTQAVTTCTISSGAWHGRLRVNIGGISTWADAPPGPRYEITIAITAPMFPLTSDGKAPDISPFQGPMATAIQSAAKRAGKDVAALMNANEKFEAAIADEHERQQRHEQRLADHAERAEKKAKTSRQHSPNAARVPPSNRCSMNGLNIGLIWSVPRATRSGRATCSTKCVTKSVYAQAASRGIRNTSIG